jgi:glycine dehydrogenase
MVIDLSGMDVANASLLDEATAAAEAMTFCKRVSRSKSMRFFVAHDCHPQTVDVIKTRAEPMDFELVHGNVEEQLNSPDTDLFGALIQYPGTFGDIHELENLLEKWHESGTMRCEYAFYWDIKSVGEILCIEGKQLAEITVQNVV